MEKEEASCCAVAHKKRFAADWKATWAYRIDCSFDHTATTAEILASDFERMRNFDTYYYYYYY